MTNDVDNGLLDVIRDVVGLREAVSTLRDRTVDVSRLTTTVERYLRRIKTTSEKLRKTFWKKRYLAVGDVSVVASLVIEASTRVVYAYEGIEDASGIFKAYDEAVELFRELSYDMGFAVGTKAPSLYEAYLSCSLEV